MSTEALLVLGTMVTAAASWALVAITYWAMRGQRRDSKDLLQAQIAMKLDEQFDSSAMRRSRRVLASQLLAKEPIDGARALDFFETVGMYYVKDRVDLETVYN